MKTPYEILIRPILTEKMLSQQENLRKYAFEVDRRATKIDIKRAVEARFDVSVEKVNTITVHGKSKRQQTRRGLTRGKSRSWKKAIVTLRPGDSIDFFAGTNV
ncbi:MAG TPA: 50S ribosomal protein L23 [Bacteroidetes bacterium]|nr:50S ribosomal protein L23 [Bacteroidota bacterium]